MAEPSSTQKMPEGGFYRKQTIDPNDTISTTSDIERDQWMQISM